MVSVPSMSFPLDPEVYAAQPVPSLQEFERLWLAWDITTRHMIAEDEMLSKPINLRNCCLFYLGHIPAFLDTHLTRATGQTATTPASYHTLFERGIDPDVENPEKCHAHSEIPAEWPPLKEIIDYQDRVRARTRGMFSAEGYNTDPKIGRALWIGFEHEGEKLGSLIILDSIDQIIYCSHASGNIALYASSK